MYRKLPNLVIGFHGCERKVFQDVVFHGKPMKASNNEYDWLGNGIYFWEQNYQRALEWALKRPSIKEPAVIGAVIDLGYCLNLTDTSSSNVLRTGYDLLKARCSLAGIDMPKNIPSEKTEDILLRHLDCAVIQQIHDYNSAMHGNEYDSVRGIFYEGAAVYEGSCFREKTHVQICIRNPNCIKGLFNPLQENREYSMP